MEFKLYQFAKKELKKYKIFTPGEYDIDNPGATETEREILAVVYKRKERSYQNRDDGGRVVGGLTGKALKKYNLKLNEVIEVEGLKYKIVDVTPRIYADFVEFGMELMRNGE